jgi:mannonate dehydratase
MKQTWRWYGPNDPVSLDHVKQAGATGIVNALHHIDCGEVWKVSEILKRKKIIESSALTWDVVESLPVHENIKTRRGNFHELIDNYKKSMSNLSMCGVKIICYNFMPILDWTRTKLDKKCKDGSKALEFNLSAIRAFDLFILKRKNANLDYMPNQIKEATDYFNSLSKHEKIEIENNILKGLPGSKQGYSLKSFKNLLKYYSEIGHNDLRNNLIYFLKDIIVHAKSLGILMCIHPDDPPISLFGLPRIVSNEEDFEFIFKSVPEINNGITFCTGSLGVIKENNLVKIFNKFASRVHFIHLRNTKRDSQGNFYEENHLEGDVDMYEIVLQILKEQKKRYLQKRLDFKIPMRPDHGHQMLDDLNKSNKNPGYSAIGRLRGLAELRGLELGILKSM